MKRIIFLSAIILLLSNLPIYGANPFTNESTMEEYYENSMQSPDYTLNKAVIKGIVYDDTKEERDIPIEADIRYQHLEIEIYSGPHKGEELTIRHTIERLMPGVYEFKTGDKILLRITEKNDTIETVRIQEKVRDTWIYLAIGLFVLLLIIGKLNGLKALLSLTVTILLFLFAYIPMIIKGLNPLLSSIGISILSIVLMLFIISGFHIKTYVAITGTALGVVFSGLIALFFGHMAQLTGLASDNSISLAFIPQFRHLDYRGLLFGTIIIGAIGAIMDVAISIASAMWEIREIHPHVTEKELIRSGMNIGKDIMGSMSNTLILAYIGTTLHLIILFSVYQYYFMEIINLDSIGTEIIRAMSGSIGLILTIPITVWIAAKIFLKKPSSSAVGKK
ncbi:MAG: YibE/F family protein [Tissierellia bacterium]|nr:YibE/F family protein [Tissierellia bacterium]